MASKDLTVPAAQPFNLVPYEPDEYMLPGEKLSPRNLHTFKVPSGTSGPFFTMPDGTPAKTLSAVILHASRSRTYWVTSMEDGGGDNPPDCSSNDGIFGQGLYGTMMGEDGTPIVSNANPSGKCETCPMAQFGSGKGNAQACREGVRVLLLLDNDPLPAVLSVSPASIDAFFNYRMRVLRPLGIRPHETVTLISLVADKSKSGVAYFQVRFELGDKLDDASLAAVENMRAMFPSAS